jgi:hypothetical protein
LFCPTLLSKCREGKEKFITKTLGNYTFGSSIADEDYKEICIGLDHEVSVEKENEK